MTSEALKALAERVEGATGPDRELDEALMALVYVRDKRHIGATEGWEDEPDSFVPVKEFVWVDPATDRWVSTAAYNFTSSIDAALGLVERVLSGYRWGVASAPMKTGFYPDGKPSYGDGFKAHLTEPSALRPMPSVAQGVTPPLAILAALLRALLAKGE